MSPIFSIANQSDVTRKREKTYKLDANRRGVEKVLDEVN